jgi:methionine-gamma-lyase
MMDTKKSGFDTKLVHAGFHGDPTGAVNVPIYQTSTFAFKDAAHGASLFAGEQDGFIYTRIGNPTIRAFEDNVAELENGYGGIATGSGMGAVSTVFFALLSSGDHLISTDSVYGPSRGLVENYLSRFGISGSFVNTSKLEDIQAAFRPQTRVIYIETPSNPSMLVTDIKAVAEKAHAHGCLLVVDNTFASPYLQNLLI